MMVFLPKLTWCLREVDETVGRDMTSWLFDAANFVAGTGFAAVTSG
jgi:hypothetical protein